MNWKTTTCGVLVAVVAWLNAVIAVLDGVASTVPDFNTPIALTIAAIGLILAKDAK